MTGGPSAAFYRGNWMKMNKQKTQHRWRKAAAGLLALLLSFGMACSAFAETAVGAGALRKSAAAGVQMVDAGTHDAAAQADNTPRRMESCVVKLDRYLAVCSGQAQTPKVLAVTYTYTREVSKPKPSVNREESAQTKPEESQAKVETQTKPEKSQARVETQTKPEESQAKVEGQTKSEKPQSTSEKPQSTSPEASEEQSGSAAAENSFGTKKRNADAVDASAAAHSRTVDEGNAADTPAGEEGDEEEAESPEIETITETLAPEEYTVRYLDADGKEIQECTEIGEYTVVVTGKGRYTGTATAAYTILGKPQKMTTSKMRYRMIRSDKPLQLSARADGDGTGITWESRNEGVATVSENGLVTPQGLGRVYIYAQTTGNRVSQPAKLRFTVEICPERTTRLSVRRSGDESADISWNPVSGANRYELRYATEADFAKKEYQSLTVNKNTLFTELTSLRKGQAYLIQLRAVSEHEDGRGNTYRLCGAWSSVKKITAARRSIQMSDHLMNVLKVRAHFLR